MCAAENLSARKYGEGNFGKLHTLRSLEYGMLKKIIDMQKSN